MRQNGSYFAGIDGLRSLAILSVFLFHIQPEWLPGGFTGVDLFFVISGFVVSYSIYRDSEQGSFFPFLARFYKRRLVRIYPALLACLVVSVAALVLFVPDSWLGRANKVAAIAAFFGVSNFALHRASDGYFSEGAEYNPFGHTWSLAVEEQFYFVFPLLFFIWRRLSKRDGRRLWLAELVIPSLMVASLAYCAWLTTHDKSAAFYLLPTRFWELGMGYAAFRVHQAIGSTSNRAKVGVQFFGMAMLLVGFFFCGTMPFPFPGALIPSLAGFLLVIGASMGSPAKSGFDRFFESLPMTYLGKMSYSLYLWHWPVFAVFRWTVGFEKWWQFVIASMISIAFAYCSLEFIETPFRKSSRIRNMRSWIFIMLSCLAIVFLAGASAVALKLHSRLTLSVTGEKSLWYAEFKDEGHPRVKTLTAPFSDFLFKAIRPEAGGGSRDRVFLIGDSHSSAYWQNFGNYAIANNVELIVMAKGGCSIGALFRPMDKMKPECPEFYSFVKRYLEDSLRPGDIVFIGSMKSLHFSRKDSAISSMGGFLPSKEAVADHHRAVAEFTSLLEQLATKRVVVSTNGVEPLFASPAYRCSDWFNRMNPACARGLQIPRSALLSRSKLEIQALLELDQKYEFFELWEPFPVLCPDSICHAVRDGKPLFFDADHLSGNGNLTLYPSLSKHLDSLRAKAQRIREDFSE